MYTGYYQLEGDITTFGSDLAIANAFGLNAVKDTVKRCVEEWSGDYKYYTWLIGNMNAMSWLCYEKGLEDISEYYADQYYEHKHKYYKMYSRNDEAIHYYYDNID